MLYKYSGNGLPLKKKLRSNQILDTKHLRSAMNSTGNKKYKLRSMTSSSSSFPNPNNDSKQRELVSAVDGSSCLKINEPTEIIYRHGKTTLRALSDNESESNDLENAGSSFASYPSVKTIGTVTKPSSGNVRLARYKYEDSSSSDSNESFIRVRRGYMRVLSDYETGDQSGESCWSNQDLNKPTNSSKQNDDLDLSSENDSVYNVIRSKYKRPHNLFSTSDSSDSDTPIGQQCLRKRKRINTSSEDSDEGDLSATQSHRRDRLNQNDRPRTSRSLAYQNSQSQTTRKLRSKINNQRIYHDESDSDSSGDEILSLSRQSPDENSDTNNIVSNNGHLNRRHNSEPNCTSRSPITGQQVIRQSRSMNNELETQQTSASRRESESNSAFNIFFSKFRKGSRNNVSPIQNDSSDSDSDIPFRQRRVKGGTVCIQYSDSDSNSEHWLPEFLRDSVTGNPPIIPHESLSDSDAESEKCPICFSCLASKEVASPVSCDHIFCTNCIQEWAKSNNTCPIDRKQFNKIVVRYCLNGSVLREIPVETRTWVNDHMFEEEFDPTFNMEMSSEEDEEEEICSLCRSSNNSQNLILCDYCNTAYHLSCLVPPLRYVPARDWFCPRCVVLEIDEYYPC